MSENNKRFPPEGLCPAAPYSLASLKNDAVNHTIREAVALRCDADHTLHFSLGGISAQMTRQDAIAPWISGSNRDIAVLSMVGKQVCFTVKNVLPDEKGAPIAHLSRAEAQETAMACFMEELEPGMVLTCRVTHMEPFGVFLDIGCGIIAMLPIEHISVSRIPHPNQRFEKGQKILAVVASIDREKRRITMTHRELLGTWMENASHFAAGDTVRGIVRSVKSYGSFVELAPNLSGLTDSKLELAPGDHVSVFIKSIRPEGMKIKLQVVEKLLTPQPAEPLSYQITDGKLDHWVYSPPGCQKTIETIFTETSP